MNGSILIVDDMVDVAGVVELSLKKAGFSDTRVVTDPARVMEIVAESPPDLVILDLRMPEMDGFELLDLLVALGDPPSVLVLTADCSTKARNRALAAGAKDFVNKPYDTQELVLRARNLLETRLLHRELRRLNQSLEATVRERTADLWKAVQEVEKSENAVRHSREQTVIRLALAAELRDDETKNHVTRVSHYAEIIATAAGYDKESSALIRLASVMHDVGKIGIPSKVVLSRGKLSPEERLTMHGHCEIGHRILSGSETPLLDLAASIALTHHERFDGNGYPCGLVGPAIPEEGRIVAIADVFDALTTDRVYRRKFDIGTALHMMKEDRGIAFDPELLDLFFGCIDEVLTIKEQNEDAA